MITFPRFLRFDRLELQNCQIFVEHLQLLKEAFNDSTLIHFDASISDKELKFNGGGQNFLSFYNHIRHEFAPICDSIGQYSFTISNVWDHDSSEVTSFIASILQIPQINRSTNVYFCICNQQMIQLPVDEISNWLNRKSEDKINNCKKQRERLLQIRGGAPVRNAREMCDFLKEVRFLDRFNF